MISIDFELFWGMRDKKDPQDVKIKFQKTRDIILNLLQCFEKYEIHATWATVGFLMFSSKQDLLKNMPLKKPSYTNKNLSPYNELEKIQEENREIYFAEDLIKKIKKTRYQEIGTHTFSHYYTLEKGQNLSEFREDLKKAIELAKSRFDVEIKSIVFPRNQFSASHLKICKELGIIGFRGNEKHPLYHSANEENINFRNRVTKYLDAFFNISGDHIYSIKSIHNELPYNIGSSRFLYWYNPYLFFMEPFRKRRIFRLMKKAAKQKKIFHLWFHPHNFANDEQKNMSMLKKILKHFRNLNQKYNMQSSNMEEIGQLKKNEKEN